MKMAPDLIQIAKRFMKRTPIYPSLIGAIQRRKQRRQTLIELDQWLRSGRPVPPPHVVKQRTLLEYRKQFRLQILVETGTYLGEMVEATKGHFKRVYSIELSPELHQAAAKRFRADTNVELICGDSGKLLSDLVRKLGQPALFWLDGHYSWGNTARGDKDTPILEELEAILCSPERHVIVIDDARCFGSEPTYPALDQLKAFVHGLRPDLEIEVKDDSIRVTPKRPAPSCVAVRFDAGELINCVSRESAEHRAIYALIYNHCSKVEILENGKVVKTLCAEPKK